MRLQCSVIRVSAVACVIWFGVSIGLPIRAVGQADCPVGCNMKKRECISTGRTTKLACKQDCKVNTAPQERGACNRTCTDTFRGTKTGCRSDHRGCLELCVPPSHGICEGGNSQGEMCNDDVDCPGGVCGAPADGSCISACGADLAACASGVVRTVKDCVSPCRTAADRVACLQSCATTAAAGGQDCAAAFQSCLTGCAQ